MPWPFRAGRTVTVTRDSIDPRTRERLGQPETHTLARCAFDSGSVRQNSSGDQVIQSPRVFGPYDADVVPGDLITIAGIDGTFEVDGDVLRLRNEFTGREHACEIKLVRKRGAS